jgi:hypothetical protein
MYRHWSVSFAQVATVCWPWHAVPVCAQIVATHVHEAVPPMLVHAWCVPHVAVVTHSSQPLGPFWHVWTPVLMHCVLPALQAFTHDGASLALPPSPGGGGGASVADIASPPGSASVVVASFAASRGPAPSGCGPAPSGCGIVASVVASEDRRSRSAPSPGAEPSPGAAPSDVASSPPEVASAPS